MVVVTVVSEVTQQSLRASRAVGSAARAVRSLRMLPTGTIVPVTIGESGKLTIGHALVVVTVLSGSEKRFPRTGLTYFVCHSVLQPLGAATAMAASTSVMNDV